MGVLIYKGQKYINGYSCDGMGRPITTKNGYSSQDEKEAKQAYKQVLKEIESEKEDILKIVKQKNEKEKEELLKIERQENERKFSKKFNLTANEHEDEIQVENYGNNDLLKNDQEQEISLENGYSDSDELENRK